MTTRMHMKKRGKRMVFLAALTGVIMLAFGAVAAFADAPVPDPNDTTGTVVVNHDGSRTVTLQGEWDWTTHKTDCNNDKRAVGYAVDWNDPQQAGNHVTTLNGTDVSVGAASANSYNPADNAVHENGGCGTFSASAGYNSGLWGPITHTYSPAFTGQIQVCVLNYDVHLKSNGGAPNANSEITAGGNGHNPEQLGRGQRRPRRPQGPARIRTGTPTSVTRATRASS